MGRAHAWVEPVLAAPSRATRIDVHGRVAIVADSAMQAIYDLLRQLAVEDLAVLLGGETGVGKELAARALHAWSPSRSARPFVAVNCAALPPTLIDSELFGHRRGAFTGADRDRVGYLQAADGGTLFLDEVGELALTAQAKLLRALDAGTICRVGDSEPVPIDVRIVSATNRCLADEMQQNRFRPDLYYRLRGASIRIPPLRERPADVRALADAFIDEMCSARGRTPVSLSTAALEALLSRRFPGNARELRNLLCFAVATSAGEVIGIESLGSADAPASESVGGFRPIAVEVAELEARRMREALQRSNGNRTEAARLIDMPRRTFTTKMAKYGIVEGGTTPLHGQR